MGRKAAARRRHRTAPTGTGNPGRIDQPEQSGGTGEPGGTGKPGTTGLSGGIGQSPRAADGPARADTAPGGRLPPHQEPKPKRPVRTIRVPGLFG
ncbi:hypothetical protein ACO0M4_14400 [Streptomyces sp. RGM 3693]|uniref:hypothetical protein n=1 Tax=Streptomyces sp. RGM 3693 TaxID=3413284 RepID=UPI003D2D4EF8